MTKEKEQIFFDNIGLVRMVAKRYEGKTKVMDSEDIFQSGCIGLIKAIEKFDEAAGYQFSTYASSVITNEILKDIEQTDRLVRIQQQMYELATQYTREHNETGIKLEEFATRTGHRASYIAQAQCALKDFYSFDGTVVTDEGMEATLGEIVPDKAKKNEHAQIYYEELQQEVDKALKRLQKHPRIKQRDVEILKKWIGIGCERKNHRELSAEYKMSFQRIQQITSKSLKVLRDSNKDMQDYIALFEEYDMANCVSTVDYSDDEYER